MAKKKTKKDTEKVTEVFDIEKPDGKIEKEVVKKSEVKKKHAGKKQLKKQEKQLRNFLIIIGVLILFVVLIFSWMKMVRVVHYGNVKFDVVSEGQLILYNTRIPVYENGEHTGDDEFYLRTNPKDLEKVPFEGDLVLLKGYTLNITKEFTCNGYGTIAFVNLVRQYQSIGSVLINDENAGCDESGKYIYYEVKEGNGTKIVQRGNSSCYDIYVKDCEILPATEKVMAETFVKFNELE